MPAATPRPDRPDRPARICGHRRPARFGAAVALALLAAACSPRGSGDDAAGPAPAGSSGSGTTLPAPTTVPAPPCTADPIPVVVTVDQWSDVTRQLGGQCVTVTTIIAGSSADPHDYEPSPGDQTAIGAARLVVANGLGYDAWAARAVDARATKPVVIEAGTVAGRHEGDNPHVWYEPVVVEQLGGTITGALRDLAPAQKAYFDDRLADWTRQQEPYVQLVADVQRRHAGKRFGATEPVFDDLGAALGLDRRTPEGYAAAMANDAEPSVADVAAFRQAISGGDIDVLIINTQTEGSLPRQLRDAAIEAGVPVVEVTETLPPGQTSFAGWQMNQLRRLDEALTAGRRDAGDPPSADPDPEPAPAAQPGR